MAGPGLLSTRVPRRYRDVEEYLVSDNRVRLLRNGVAAFPAMLEAIEQAQSQVLLEMYWFDSDTIGRRFAEALRSAAERGVNVAVIYDAVGSIQADSGMFDELEQSGVRVLEYNPVKPWRHRFRAAQLTRRDHRKILVVDEAIGFTGGINIGDPWMPPDDPESGWRDDMVRIEGPAVRGFIECFHGVWQRQTGEALGRVAVDQRRAAMEDPDGERSTSRVRVLGEAYFRNRREIVRGYLSNIYSAKRRVWLTNSYFVPDRSVKRALVRAARRGVDVRVLLPGISDVWVVRHASRAMWGSLLRAGVRIFEWTQNVLHAKTAVVDGEWSTIGTFNLDHLSLFSNLEVNAAIRDAAFARALESSFERDLEQSREVRYEDFRWRPLGDRVAEAVLYRFRALM